MASKPVLIDGYCGAGGATKGYQRAGFYVIGVDVWPQPNYCGDEFVQADFLTFPLDGAQAVHASPPCQRWTAYGRRPEHVGEYPDLIAPTRTRLVASGAPYVIENIPGTPLEAPIMLCGSMFDLDVQRHRLFETSWGLEDHPWPCRHGIWAPRYPQATNRRNLRRTVEVGVWRIPLADQLRAMGIDWMAIEELSEAIPPAYTEWIGARLFEVVQQGVR